MRLKKFTAYILAGAAAVSVALGGCGSTINTDAVGATLSGEEISKKEISMGFMNFMAKYQQAVYEGYFISWYGTDMWNTDMYGDGSTMEASTKDSIAENIEVLYLLEAHMADYGVEITEEETNTMEEAAKKFISDNSNKAVKQIGATEEYVKEMLRLYTIQHKMQEAIYAEVDTEVSDEEAAQRTFSYIKIDMEADSSEDTSGEEEETEAGDAEASDKAVEDLAVTAKEVATAAKQDLEAAAENAGYTVSTYSYGADEESMDEGVIAAADALKEGEISDLITAENAYYILRLDSEFDKEATETKKESIISTRKSEYYTEICYAYKEKADFSLNEEEWAKVKFDKLFNVISAKDETEGETDTTADTDAEAETGEEE